MRDFNLLPLPTGKWMHRLRQGHYIWLVKEQQIAQVGSPWESPDPGCISGRMFIARFNSDHIIGRPFVGYDYWYVDGEGKGFDRKQLIQPTQDNLPENPDPIPEPEVRRIYTALENMERRVRFLESQISSEIR